jgi:hypothetical protein
VIARVAALLALCALPALPGCNACSEDCSNPREVGAGCGCSSDQDCTKPGEILLCESGKCVTGNPADAPATSCDGDGDCKDGEKCGFGRCQAAPKCERIDVSPLKGALHADSNASDVEAVTVDRTSASSCAHAFAFANPAAPAATLLDFAVTIDTDGSATVTGDCTAGVWNAALRAGVFECTAGPLVVADRDPCFTGVANTACPDSACATIDNDIDATAGVCR